MLKTFSGNLFSYGLELPEKPFLTGGRISLRRGVNIACIFDHWRQCRRLTLNE